jgi:hypothetical protein
MEWKKMIRNNVDMLLNNVSPNEVTAILRALNDISMTQCVPPVCPLYNVHPFAGDINFVYDFKGSR